MAPSWANTPNGTMAAAVLTSPGAATPQACFTYDAKYPRPTLPSPDWTLVRVQAAGLNRAELRSRANHVPDPDEFNIFRDEFHTDPPKILGEEFVGVVELAGDKSGFKPGENVFGFVYGGGKAHDGSYAQFTLCHRRRLFRLPVGVERRLGWEVVGAAAMSLVTAWGGVNLAGGLERRLKERKSAAEGGRPSPVTVLIHGGSSSVGVWATLYAKDRGATVVATTRNREKVAQLKKIGNDHVLLDDELDTELLKLFPNGIDIILELVGPDQSLRSLELAARNGTVVVMGILGLEWDSKGFNPFMIPPTRNLSMYSTINRAAGNVDDGLEDVEAFVAEVLEKVEQGVFPVESFLDKTFRLDEAGDAHAYMEENKAVGKVVLIIPQE